MQGSDSTEISDQMIRRSPPPKMGMTAGSETLGPY